MNGWGLASSIIDNIFSWPVAVLIIVFILRGQLAELLRTVRSFVLEAGSTRVSIERELMQARESLAEAKTSLSPRSEADEADEGGEPDEPAGPPDERFEKRERDLQFLNGQYQYVQGLAQSNPNYAVEVAWDRLVADPVREFAFEQGLPFTGDTMHLLKSLRSRGVVSEAILESTKFLNNIRIRAVTAKKDVSPGEAEEYVEVTWNIARYLIDQRNTDQTSPID